MPKMFYVVSIRKSRTMSEEVVNGSFDTFDEAWDAARKAAEAVIDDVAWLRVKISRHAK
jgi:hypothetical protein